MKTWETKSGYRVIQILSGRSNVFLLTNGKKNILVDTSTGYMWKTLKKRLRNLDVKHIDYLILTHTHFDHAENSNRIKEKYNAQVIVHKKEASYLLSGTNIIPEGTNMFTRIIVSLLAKKYVPETSYTPCQYDLLVDKVFDFTDIGLNAYILHTSGHTTGSMSVIIDNEIALVGDTMFGVFMGSAFPPYANDIKQIINSWGRLLETGCSIFIPGHGSANPRSLVMKDYSRRMGLLKNC